MEQVVAESYLKRETPRRRMGLVARALPDELVLYAPETDRAYLLNQVSAAIWEMCNGQNSLWEIAHEIAARYSAPMEEAAVNVEATVAHLRHAGRRRGSDREH